MIPALALLLLFCPWGNDLYALPKAVTVCSAVFVSFWYAPPQFWPRDLRPWAYMAVALAVSTLFSWDLGYSLVSVDHSRGLGLFQWAVCAIVFLYGLNVAIEDVDKSVLYGGALMAVLALGQRFALPGRAAWGSTQGSPVLLGEMLVVCLPVAWRLNRFVAYLFMIAAGATHCRSAIIAMGVSIAYLLWRDRR